jgi:hypothetical protein
MTDISLPKTVSGGIASLVASRVMVSYGYRDICTVHNIVITNAREAGHGCADTASGRWRGEWAST